MPAYETTTVTKPVADQGRNVAVWSAETVTVGTASQRLGLNRDPNLPSCFSVELAFVADPGVFAVDVQTADTDAEKYYITKTTINAVNAGFVGRAEIANVVARFVRLKLVSRANSTPVTAKIF